MMEAAGAGGDRVMTILPQLEGNKGTISSKLGKALAQDVLAGRTDILAGAVDLLSHESKQVRAGAVGGDTPDESFAPGSAAIISNSGNMVNTIASYLQSAGIGVSYGIATGKDPLILSPLKEWLRLAHGDRRTRLIVLYVEPGGAYEEEAIAYLRSRKTVKPIVVYVSGSVLEKQDIALGVAEALATRVAKLSARVGLQDRICLTGGVAKNAAVAKSLEKAFNKTLIGLQIDPQIIGALGAAIFAKEHDTGHQVMIETKGADA